MVRSRWVSGALIALLAMTGCGAASDASNGGPSLDASVDGAAELTKEGGSEASLEAGATDDVPVTDAAPTSDDACIPLCQNRQCGPDGCGMSCGDCPADSACTDGQCVPLLAECPCSLGECSNCYCGHALVDFTTSSKCRVPDLEGNENNLFSCLGGHWSVGTRCEADCAIAAPHVADSCTAPTPTPGTHHLFIAWDPSTAGCRAHDESFFHCVLEHTQFNAMAMAYSTGRGLTFGTSAVLDHNCAYIHSTGATDSQDTATLQCIEDQVHFALNDDDVLLYYPSGTGCADGRNHWHIPVIAPKGRVAVEIALAFTGTGCNCQTALGTHEVFEAAARWDAADCCNGQDHCAATPGPFGWYTLSGCAGGDYTAQTISPAAHEFAASFCTRLNVQ